MRASITSCRGRGAVTVNVADSFEAVNVVEARVWGKAAAVVTIFAQRPRDAVLFSNLMSHFQPDLEEGAMSD